MAPSRRRSRSVPAEDTNPTNHGRKRIRLQGSAHASTNNNNSSREDEDDDEYHPLPPEEEVAETKPPTNGFHPGAIIRVQLQNFVTYERAEFLPGPSLNMVIGPNGTGKSSLVCAICLGLGYHSNVLGRATSFGEFVKHGKDTALVEIELQRKPGEATNPVVTLRINREDNSRKFLLNRREVPLKRIQKLNREYRIQIDNLCQFLPQDKVAEFAGLSPVELLAKTLQAAASEEMAENQERLKQLYRQERELRDNIQDDNDKLRNMEQRQRDLQPHVERMQERADIEKQIEFLEKALSVISYSEALQAYKAAKGSRRAAADKLERIKQGAGPAMEVITKKEKGAQRVRQSIAHFKEALKRQERAAEQAASEVTRLEDGLKDIEIRRQAEKGGLADKKNEARKIRAGIAELERKIQNPPQPFSTAEFNTRIREQQQAARALETELREIVEEKEDIQRRIRHKVQDKIALEGDIRNLNTKEGQQFNLLERLAPDAAKGYKWLQQNKHLFEKEVFGPPMLTCSPKDKTYSNHLQALIRPDDFLCFVTQSTNDHTKLSAKFYKDLGLSVTIRTCLVPLDSFKRPVSAKEVRKLGFDGFALDYLDGPDLILSMLCSEARLHMTGVAKEDITSEQFAELQRHNTVTAGVAGSISYKVARRWEYGPDATSTSTRHVNPGQFWTEGPVDSTQKDEYQRKLNEIKSELMELDGLRAQKEQRREQLSEERTKMLKTAEDIKAQKDELQRAQNQYNALPGRLQNEKDNLNQKAERIREAMANIVVCNSKHDDKLLQQFNAVLTHTACLPRLEAAYNALLEAELRLVEADSEVSALKQKHRELADLVREGEDHIKDLEREEKHQKAVAARGRDLAVEILAGLGDEDRREMDGWRDRTAQEARDAVEAERSKLEFVQVANPQVIQEYNRRATEIERLKKHCAEREGLSRDTSRKIQEIRVPWERELDELIDSINSAFSYNFEQINCAGEVSVDKDDDFEKWAIEIKVKFRENETLQKLDQHRQSGGERSVSTIFYLMSLQSMAQAPFRVVDEINQGMDPRNERTVHERMVQIACNEHRSQYFLITPKLLTNLRYHPRMKILCIASGPEVPAGNRKVDFGEFLKIQKRLIASAG